MAKAIIILALIATAYGAVLKNEGILLHRVMRSPCSTCGPPPPPLLRTHNWSGLARSPDGRQNTIFSGAAAAAAADQGPLNGGEAFSLASSSAGADLDETANSGSSSSSGGGAGSSSNGAAIEKTSGASYDESSGVKGGFAAGGYDGGHKVSREEFKESHFSYHGAGGKDFGVHEGSRQDGQVAASSSSLNAAQSQSFGGYNKEAAFGGGNGGNGAFSGRGDVDETQNQNRGFSGHNKNEHFASYGTNQESNQQDGQVRDFHTVSSPGQSSSYDAKSGGAHGHGFSTENQRDSSSLERNERRNKPGQFQPEFSGGQEIRRDNSFSSANRQRSFGSGSSNQDERRTSRFESNRGEDSQGHFESGFSSEGKKEQFNDQARHRPLGPFKQSRGFDASESQSSSSNQEGLSSGQHQENSGNQGQLQTSSLGGSFGQVGLESKFPSSSGQQGYLRGSGSADAQPALSGALNLASQGLQASSQAGCTTCGKSSYALSNAKSRSGSAVAVSIGG